MVPSRLNLSPPFLGQSVAPTGPVVNNGAFGEDMVRQEFQVFRGSGTNGRRMIFSSKIKVGFRKSKRRDMELIMHVL